MTNDLKESSTDYLPDGYVEDEPMVIVPNIELANDIYEYLKNKNCKHGTYKLAKIQGRWQIVCANCKSTHVNPDELDEITDWMSSLCRGA